MAPKKSSFTAQEHTIFHENIGKIIYDSKTPSEILDGVYEYINNEGINLVKANDMMFLSCALVIHRTLLMLYDEFATLSDKFSQFKVDFIDGFNAQLANLMWHYTFRHIELKSNDIQHEDAQFVEYVRTNYKTMVKVVGKWISLWFYILSMPKISIRALTPVLSTLFADIDYSIELLIFSYFYALYDFITLQKMTIETVAQLDKVSGIIDKAIENMEPEPQEHEFKFDGKSFKILNKTKH